LQFPAKTILDEWFALNASIQNNEAGVV
jgi:hypothetical protein